MKSEKIQSLARSGALASCVALAFLAFPGAVAMGQAEAPGAERLDPYELITIELPGRIEIGPDGEAELVMVKWGPDMRGTIQSDERLWIKEIPIHRRAADGSLRVGMVFENTIDDPAETLRLTQPARVVAEDDGSYSLEFAERTATVERAGRFPPGFARYAPGSDSAPVVYRQDNEERHAAQMERANESMDAHIAHVVFDAESVINRADRFVKTPAWVYIGEDRQTPILETADLGPLGPEDDDVADDVLGRKVQLFTYLPNGDVHAGAVYFNTTDRNTIRLHAFKPSKIYVKVNGVLIMGPTTHSTMEWGGHGVPLGGGFEPGYVRAVGFSRLVNVERIG